MNANRFGSRFSITSFGESHGPAMGVVIEGCPAGVDFQIELLQTELKRRRPGAHSNNESLVSDRNEQDQPEILSGIFENKTLGTPISILVKNKDQRSQDYESIKNNPRKGHADDTWASKFEHVDHRGGGRSSGRETISRVMAGSVAQMLLTKLSPETKVFGYASQIGPIQLTKEERNNIIHSQQKTYFADTFPARLPSESKSKQARDLLLQAKELGKSYGGIADIWIHNPPRNLGQPVFHKLKADLAHAFMGVGAVTGVELGHGFDAAHMEGTEFHSSSESQRQYGGIRGGITTGEDILFRVAFKPTSSVLDIAKKGRHDPCIVPRALPVLEAMSYLVLADHLLWSLSDRC